MKQARAPPPRAAAGGRDALLAKTAGRTWPGAARMAFMRSAERCGCGLGHDGIISYVILLSSIRQPGYGIGARSVSGVRSGFSAARSALRGTCCLEYCSVCGRRARRTRRRGGGVHATPPERECRPS
eukprot:6133668-Prymnesium_polylepis.1